MSIRPKREAVCYLCRRRGHVPSSLDVHPGQSSLCVRCFWVASSAIEESISGLIYVSGAEEPETRLRLAPVRGEIIRQYSYWSRFCGLCERLERRECFVLRRVDSVCLRCIIDLYRQLSLHIQSDGARPPIVIRDYSILSGGSFEDKETFVTDEFFDQCELTFRRKLRHQALCLDYGHGPSGLRIRYSNATSLLASSSLGRHQVAEPPPGAPAYDLAGPCSYCHATRSLMPWLGVSRASAHAICYECVVVGHDAFREDGSHVLRSERPPSRSPVHWLPAGRSRRRQPPELTLAPIAIPRAARAFSFMDVARKATDDE
jgi:hypothetical protein